MGIAENERRQPAAGPVVARSSPLVLASPNAHPQRRVVLGPWRVGRRVRKCERVVHAQAGIIPHLI